MTQRNISFYTFNQLYRAFKENLSFLVDRALTSGNVVDFKKSIKDYLLSLPEEQTTNRLKTIDRLLRILDYDGKTIHELSAGEDITLQSISWLWLFLRKDLKEDVSVDLFIDLYKQFRYLDRPVKSLPDRSLVKKQMNRWPTGLDPEVIEIREKNKQRIINCLIRKIERRHAPNSKYQFNPDMTYEEKYNQVSEWWKSSRFHLGLAIKSPSELNYFLDHSLSEETMRLLLKGRKKGMPFFVTPYYLSLLNTGEGYDDRTIRTYVLYSQELIETYGEIHAWEKEDTLVPGKPNAAGWLLPEGNNIHRRYPEVAILIPDSMGRACGGLCASCQRMYDFQSERLNFEFESLKPKESWDKKLRRLMQYFEDDAQLRDILITGGDALMSQNATLRKILEAVYRMAVRKRKANEKRPQGEKYAELLRVRLGSRLLAYLPLRVTEELVSILREFREKASEIGVKQFFIQTHFQSPLELTPEALNAIKAIQSAGWTITNQLVFTVAASRKGHTARLRQTLNSVGVVCYYTFSVKGFHENYAMFTPNSRSVQETYEEKVYGMIPEEKRGELHELIRNKKPLGKHLTQFLKENKLLFASTDRNVLNLPAIGKSMSFVTVGFTSRGQRILRFDHDTNRRHSPIINQIGQVYIVENKSIAAYLRQLKDMGEDINEYSTIWDYCEGKTEPRFTIYKYPEYDFELRDELTNYSNR